MDEKTTFSGKSILLINDDDDSILLLGKILKLAGYQIQIALNEELAFLSLDSNMPDLIIIDIKSLKDRTTIFTRLRNDERTRNTPIIIGGPDINDLLHYTKFGDVDYIFKPFSSERLFNVIGNTLRSTNKANESTDLVS